MPAAHFCRTVRAVRSTLSPVSGTCSRPPEVSSTTFSAQPPNLQPAPLMNIDSAVACPLVQRPIPHIRFLSIGSRLCSTPLSDPASRRRPGASLSLLLHQDVKGTCTPKVSAPCRVHQKEKAARKHELPFSNPGGLLVARRNCEVPALIASGPPRDVQASACAEQLSSFPAG